MRRLLLTSILAITALVACQPEAYTGPLDSPVGNWEGVRSEYFFNGEMVADVDSCETTAISFFKQGVCCIENVKGTFPFTYDNTTGYLQIDMSLWEVSVLTGAEMVMTYLYTVYPSDPEAVTPISEEPVEPEVPEVKPDKNGVILPAEYSGYEINADQNGYFYINDTGETVYCNFKGSHDQDKKLNIDFWFDRHTDHFIPLVVEPKK
jgi:hypothetical protein